MEWEEVRAVETACSALAVHSAVDKGRDFVIAHIHSGYSVLRGFQDENTACLCAGAMNELFNWNELTPGEIRRAFKRLPAEIQLWMDLWGAEQATRREGLYTE